MPCETPDPEPLCKHEIESVDLGTRVPMTDVMNRAMTVRGSVMSGSRCRICGLEWPTNLGPTGPPPEDA